jgi:hypothetical protein
VQKTCKRFTRMAPDSGHTPATTGVRQIRDPGVVLSVLKKVLVTAAAALMLAGTGFATANAATERPGVAKVANAVRAAADPAQDMRAAAVYGHIINNNSGQCLAVPGGSTVEGTGLIQWGCGTWADHYWTLEPWSISGVRHYRVINYNSGQCLAVPGASTVEGTQVIQWPCGTWVDHFWRVDNYGSTSKIVNYNSQQCLAIPGASTVEGERVIQWPCVEPRMVR